MEENKIEQPTSDDLGIEDLCSRDYLLAKHRTNMGRISYDRERKGLYLFLTSYDTKIDLWPYTRTELKEIINMMERILTYYHHKIPAAGQGHMKLSQLHPSELEKEGVPSNYYELQKDGTPIGTVFYDKKQRNFCLLLDAWTVKNPALDMTELQEIVNVMKTLKKK